MEQIRVLQHEIYASEINISDYTFLLQAVSKMTVVEIDQGISNLFKSKSIASIAKVRFECCEL